MRTAACGACGFAFEVHTPRGQPRYCPDCANQPHPPAPRTSTSRPAGYDAVLRACELSVAVHEAIGLLRTGHADVALIRLEVEVL